MVFHAEGWGSKTSCPPSKVCLPWVSGRGIWDVPGILPGYPGPLGVFKKSVQKKFVHIFRSLKGAEVREKGGEKKERRRTKEGGKGGSQEKDGEKRGK